MIKKTVAILFYGLALLFFPGAILAYTFIPALAPLIPITALILVIVAFVVGAAVLAFNLKRDDPKGLLVHYGPFAIANFLQESLPSGTLDSEDNQEC